jgi:hypothetical protein
MIGTGRQRSDLVADGVPRSAGLVDIDPGVAVVMNDRGKGFGVAAAVPLLVPFILASMRLAYHRLARSGQVRS